MRRSFPAALSLLSALTCGLLVGCPQPAPPQPAGTYTVSGSVLLPELPASAAALSVVAAPTASSPNWNAPHVPGEVLVIGESSAATANTLQSLGLGEVQTQAVGSSKLRRAATPAGLSDAGFAARLAQAGLNVQPNYLYSKLSVPNDPGYPANAGVTIGGAAYDQDYLTRINAQAGWDGLAAAGLQPLGAVTAVLDTGVDTAHPDLQGRLLAGYNYGDGNGNVTDLDGHGTSSAGYIGATTNNGVGLSGLTWSGQSILPVKVFTRDGSATTTALKQGIDYAVAKGAKVINMSLGLVGTTSDTALAQSVQNAAAAGVTLVAAAGNTASDGIYYPASDPNVLAVGALARSDDLACYSARPKGAQKALDLVAPGGNAGSGTGSCLSASPYDLLALNATTQPNTNRSQSGYTLIAGTSEAAPQVAGAASLLRAFRGDLSAAQIRGVLTTSAKAVAGGPLLNVGAAVRLAAALPSSSARPYTLNVQAFQGTTLMKSFSASTTLSAGAGSAAYNIAGLPAGTYILNASLTLSGQTYTGTTSVTVSADTGGQTIAAN
ncbi:S8 family serine peptidase [Deinococcus sp.]|uniref:S8 family serine peptidase n=1 Tax=Deinococcus sp. TaxID=47478 RepID=UPI003CC68154